MTAVVFSLDHARHGAPRADRLFRPLRLTRFPATRRRSHEEDRHGRRDRPLHRRLRRPRRRGRRGTAGDDAGEPHTPPRAVALDSATVSVPLDLATGRPLVQVSVNGHGPYEFILDTGAGSSLMDAQLAQELGLAKVGETRLGDPRNPTAIAAQVVRADSMRMDGLQLSGVTLATFEMRRMMGARYGGVLGLSDLGALLVSLDYPRGRLILTRGESRCGRPRRGLLRAGAGHHQPAHQGRRDRAQGPPRLGESGELHAAARAGREVRLQVGAPGSGPGEHGELHRLHLGGPLQGNLEVAGVIFHDPEVTLSDMLDQWGNIGGDALREAPP